MLSSQYKRKLIRVSHVMRLGTQGDLQAALQGLGFSVRLNTAFIERVNLTVRHGVAALTRRTWATAQQSSHLLSHLEWWRASYHFVRPHASLRVALVEPAAARGQTAGATRPPADTRYGSRLNPSAMDSMRGALLPLAKGRRSTISRGGW